MNNFKFFSRHQEVGIISPSAMKAPSLFLSSKIFRIWQILSFLLSKTSITITSRPWFMGSQSLGVGWCPHPCNAPHAIRDFCTIVVLDCFSSWYHPTPSLILKSICIIYRRRSFNIMWHRSSRKTLGLCTLLLPILTTMV